MTSGLAMVERHSPRLAELLREAEAAPIAYQPQRFAAAKAVSLGYREAAVVTRASRLRGVAPYGVFTCLGLMVHVQEIGVIAGAHASRMHGHMYRDFIQDARGGDAGIPAAVYVVGGEEEPHSPSLSFYCEALEDILSAGNVTVSYDLFLKKDRAFRPALDVEGRVYRRCRGDSVYGEDKERLPQPYVAQPDLTGWGRMMALLSGFEIVYDGRLPHNQRAR